MNPGSGWERTEAIARGSHRGAAGRPGSAEALRYCGRAVATGVVRWAQPPGSDGAAAAARLGTNVSRPAETPAVNATKTSLEIPNELKPADGRFGCGPSKVRPEQLA